MMPFFYSAIGDVCPQRASRASRTSTARRPDRLDRHPHSRDPTHPHMPYTCCEPTTVLVAEGNHEAHVPNSVLAACSPVFAERFAISDPSDENRCVEDGVSPLEVDSFIGLCTLFTANPTIPSLHRRDETRGSSGAHLNVRRLTAALTLVHKYDCSGLRSLVAHLADWHFPKVSFAENTCVGARRGSDALEAVQPLSRWITQAHLDYVMKAQEIFPECEALLNETCLELLAHALSGGVQWSACTRFSNGYHFTHGNISVVDELPAPVPLEPESEQGAKQGLEADVEPPWTVSRSSYDPSSASLHMFLTPLILVRSRLLATTMIRLLPLLKPKNEIHVAAHLVDRGDETPPRGRLDTVCRQ